MVTFSALRRVSFLLVVTLGCGAASAAAPTGDVLFDVAGDEVWARGETYKAGFDASGARYVPFLGSAAPGNQPLHLELRELRVGGRVVPISADVSPRREGCTVSYARGPVVELYRAEPDSLEQLFRFDAHPGHGELLLRVGWQSELSPVADAGGLAFHGPRGGARYGTAVAFDARGLRVDVPVELAGDAIELRVPAEFVARAVAPITVDPLISTFAVDDTPADDGKPDVAHDASLGVYVVVWERVFSASDVDVHGRVLDASGAPLADFLVNAGPDSLSRPAIAGMEALDRFLVAGIRAGTAAPGSVEARVLDLAGGAPSLGSPFVVFVESGAQSYFEVSVGGDGAAGVPHAFCVAAHIVALGLDYVDVRTVTENGGLGPVHVFGDGDFFPMSPRLPKRAAAPAGGQRYWELVMDYPGTSTSDVLRVRVRLDGSIAPGSQTTVSSSSSHRTEAVASALEAASGELPSLFVLRDLLAPRLLLRVLRGDEPGPLVPIVPGPGFETFDAAADSDGSSFVVAYAARRPPEPDERVFVDTYALEGLEPVLTERVDLSTATGLDGQSAICATRSSAGAPQRFLAVWQERAGGDGDIEAALYDTPGPGVRYCTAAPNSVGPGARIRAFGSISIALDGYGLAVEGCPPNRPGLFYLGGLAIELPFGDGFRCIGGQTARIAPVLTTDGAGAASLLLDFDQPYGQLVQPGVPAHYQFWYRDPAGGPAQFNLSDALRVEHLP